MARSRAKKSTKDILLAHTSDRLGGRKCTLCAPKVKEFIRESLELMRDDPAVPVLLWVNFLAAIRAQFPRVRLPTSATSLTRHVKKHEEKLYEAVYG